MAMQFAVSTRNARLDAIETDAGTSAKMMLYTGAMPGNCAAATTGSKLVEFDLASDWAANASGGAKSFNNAPITASAVASGMAGYFRVYKSDGTTCQMQGLCAQAWGGSVAWALNQQCVNNGLVYKVTTAGISAASGGPTGTGSGITDNTVTWAYVGTVDMTLDNDSIANTQVVNVTSFSLTDGNA